MERLHIQNEKYTETGFHHCIWIAFSDKYVIKQGGGSISKMKIVDHVTFSTRYHLNLPYKVNILILIFHGQSGKKMLYGKEMKVSHKNHNNLM